MTKLYKGTVYMVYMTIKLKIWVTRTKYLIDSYLKDDKSEHCKIKFKGDIGPLLNKLRHTTLESLIGKISILKSYTDNYLDSDETLF